METEQGARPHVEHEVDQYTLNRVRLRPPERKMLIEWVDGLSAYVVSELGSDGLWTETLRIEIVSYPDSEETLGITIGFGSDPFITPKILLNDR